MKKVYDWDIKVPFYLSDTKQTITILLSVHTTFKEIGDKLADVLGMDTFNTTFDFYIPDQAHAANPSQNLKQNNIQEGTRVTCKLFATQSGYPTASHYLNQTKLINHEQYHLYEPKTRQTTYGLIVEGICSNTKCVNYLQTITVPLGYGEFALNKIQSGLKCPICPYRDRNLAPNIAVKDIKLVNCYYRCRGTYRAKQGFLTQKEFPLFKKVEGEQNAQLYKLIEGYNWTDLRLIIKSL